MSTPNVLIETEREEVEMTGTVDVVKLSTTLENAFVTVQQGGPDCHEPGGVFLALTDNDSGAEFDFCLTAEDVDTLVEMLLAARHAPAPEVRLLAYTSGITPKPFGTDEL